MRLSLSIIRWASLAALVPVHVALAQSGVRPRDGDVVSDNPYRFAPYDSLSDGQRRDLARSTSREEYERIRRDARFSLRKIRYGSDGLQVVAYAAAPTNPPAGPMPVVVYNRGSYIAGDMAPVLAPLMHRFAEAGFLIVAPQYRGSDGGEGRDEMGGADVHDVLNAVRFASRLRGADSSRVFMYGESRGGMMAYQALRDSARVRAAAVVGAFTDLDSLLAGDPRSRGAAQTLWPDYARERETIARRRSAVAWADAIRVPVLILHGGADGQVPPRHSLRLALQLDAAKRPYELRVLEGGSHTLDERAKDRDTMVVDWFRTHGR